MSAPDVSVLLATRDRDFVLAGTLLHMARVVEASEASVQIVVVDNGSDDTTASVLEYFEGLLPLEALSEPLPGKNRALNRGLDAVEGRLVVFTDDDVIPADGWLDALVRASHAWEAHDIFGGRVLPRYPRGRGPAFQDREFLEWAYSHWSPEQDEGPTESLPLGPNFAVRASSLTDFELDETIGPGTSSGAMGSETTFIQTLLDRGSSMVYVPGSLVGHVVTPHQLSRPYLIRRAYRLGRGIVRWGGHDRSPRIGGVPRHLWREVVSTWVGAKLPWRGETDRLRSRLAHERARGRIDEYRSGGEDSNRG